MRPRSNIPKKVREANLRKQRSKDRRFNDPLRIFLKRRYPDILIEFGQLYEHLDQLNPTRKSLINSDAFQQWMFDNPLPSTNFSIPPLPTRLPMCSPPVQPMQFSLPQLEIPLLSSSQISQFSSPSVQAGEDILGTAFREVFGSVEPMHTPLEEAEIPEEAIINELLENEFLQELLSEESELPELRGLLDEDLSDEGIELNHIDEISEDIEPFDFCELF